jgi:hypothetical protein
LEKRAFTGIERDAETYEEFLRFLDEMEGHAPAKRVVYSDMQKTDHKKKRSVPAKP